MDNWEDYLIKTRRKNRKPINENQAQQLKQKIDSLNGEIARLEVAKERQNQKILKIKVEKQRIEKLQDSIRIKKKALQAKFQVDENEEFITGDELPLGEDVEACGKPGNPNHSGPDGKFSSYGNRGSQSRHYSCGSDRESSGGSKKKKCGRDKPIKCKED